MVKHVMKVIFNNTILVLKYCTHILIMIIMCTRSMKRLNIQIQIPTHTYIYMIFEQRSYNLKGPSYILV